MNDGFEKSIIYLTEKKNIFSNQYLFVRKKENRVLKDIEVFNLPNTSKTNENYKEWKLRQESANRFLKYIKNKTDLNILEIGCGNGWFSNLIAKQSSKNNIYALDINAEELKQANRVFKQQNLQFVYANIFELSKNAFNCKFDLIVLNASIQYFKDINDLLIKVKEFSKNNCEIHIMDSFFYKENEVDDAKKRTFIYYDKLGFPEMSAYYYHHLYSDIKNFKILYQPKNLVFNRVFKNKSPFLWVFKKTFK